jgi:4-diphosphocytidyl-2C-methyl-D-erythritol kinase
MREDDHTSNCKLILLEKDNHYHHAQEIMPSIDQFDKIFLRKHDKMTFVARYRKYMYLPVKQQHHASAPYSTFTLT